MHDSMNLPDKTFTKRLILVLFQVLIQSLVNCAVGYKYTKSSKRGKNVLQDFFIISHNAKMCLLASVFVIVKKKTN